MATLPLHSTFQTPTYAKMNSIPFSWRRRKKRIAWEKERRIDADRSRGGWRWARRRARRWRRTSRPSCGRGSPPRPCGSTPPRPSPPPAPAPSSGICCRCCSSSATSPSPTPLSSSILSALLCLFWLELRRKKWVWSSSSDLAQELKWTPAFLLGLASFVMLLVRPLRLVFSLPHVHGRALGVFYAASGQGCSWNHY